MVVMTSVKTWEWVDLRLRLRLYYGHITSVMQGMAGFGQPDLAYGESDLWLSAFASLLMLLDNQLQLRTSVVV